MAVLCYIPTMSFLTTVNVTYIMWSTRVPGFVRILFLVTGTWLGTFNTFVDCNWSSGRQHGRKRTRGLNAVIRVDGHKVNSLQAEVQDKVSLCSKV